MRTQLNPRDAQTLKELLDSAPLPSGYEYRAESAEVRTSVGLVASTQHSQVAEVIAFLLNHCEQLSRGASEASELSGEVEELRKYLKQSESDLEKATARIHELEQTLEAYGAVTPGKRSETF